MSSAAAQYEIFRKQVVIEARVFTFRDDGQLLVYRVEPDGDTIPFWSSRSRLETIQSRFPKSAGWEIAELALADFWRLLDKLERDDVSVGVNWSGARLTGYNVKAADLRAGIAWWDRHAGQTLAARDDVNGDSPDLLSVQQPITRWH